MMIITAQSLGEDGSRNLLKELLAEIAKLDGKLIDEVAWGKRKFAYEIKHQKEGFYDVVNFELRAENLLQFKQKLNLNKSIVRYLITAPNTI